VIHRTTLAVSLCSSVETMEALGTPETSSTQIRTRCQNAECQPLGSKIGYVNDIKRLVFIMENGCLLRGRN